IRDLISDGLNELDALNYRIDAVRATLSELVHTRDRLAEHVHQHLSIISPLRRVPTELLCLIFAFAVSDELFFYQPHANELKSPWRIAGVCRSWRASALSYPPLW
ncbi:hypothetical protein B0H19DRAFT_885786, partial [Mycena capillaripes]